MKFITGDGKIVEGIALTEKQAALRDRFEEWLHENVCSNCYHGTYSSRPCRNAANMLIPKLEDSAVWSLSTVLFEPALVEESDSTPVSLIDTLTTSETTSQPPPENLPVSTAPTTDDLSFRGEPLWIGSQLKAAKLDTWAMSRKRSTRSA